MRVKQWMASLAIALSGGVKLVHVGLQVWNNEVDHDWFKPVPGMVLIYWIAAYALQIDYVYMLGHVPTNEDPVGYDAVRLIASKNTRRFFVAHILLFLWQLFLILNLPIFAFISIILAFFALCINYAKLHKLWRDRGNYSNEPNVSPSFLAGPTSSLLVFAALIHIPATLIILITSYHPDPHLDAIEWPLAWWILIVNIIGGHIATRTGYSAKRAMVVNNQLRLQISERGGDLERAEDPHRTIPVDLAAVIGLFWGTLAVAAGTGSVNWGPVMVIGYIGTLWQALALFGSIVD